MSAGQRPGLRATAQRSASTAVLPVTTHAILGDALGEEVLARERGGREAPGGDAVEELPVRLLREGVVVVVGPQARPRRGRRGCAGGRRRARRRRPSWCRPARAARRGGSRSSSGGEPLEDAARDAVQASGAGTIISRSWSGASSRRAERARRAARGAGRWRRGSGGTRRRPRGRGGRGPS